MNQDVMSQLKAFSEDQLTWAEIEGMTSHEAGKVAQLGCDLAEAGFLDDARVIFEGLIAGNPRDVAARAALGTVYQKLGRMDEALAEYGAALDLEPQHPVALANRGELRLLQGDEGGCLDLIEAVRTDPQGVSAAGRRAMALTKALTEHILRSTQVPGT
jgi:Flp pilus assembly protein TadD